MWLLRNIVQVAIAILNLIIGTMRMAEGDQQGWMNLLLGTVLFLMTFDSTSCSRKDPPPPVSGYPKDFWK